MKNVFFVFIVLFVFSCKNKEQAATAEETATSSEQATDTNEASGMVSLEKIWESEATLTTSESVLFDEVRGVYYVSCIGNVPPTAEDGDGFIATLDQRGNILNKSFATGLDAPKGMALSGNNLYVTDINEFVIIDLETGSMQRIAINGAEFLNDVALAPDGSLYFTDTNTNTIHRYSEGKVTEYLKDENLSNPNGIYVDDSSIYLASFSKGDFNVVDIATKSINQKVTGSIPGGDGVEPWNGGFLVSNWNGEVYFCGPNWEVDKILDTKEEKLNAADISLNKKAGELLVPTFFGNTVAAYKLVNKG